MHFRNFRSEFWDSGPEPTGSVSSGHSAFRPGTVLVGIREASQHAWWERKGGQSEILEGMFVPSGKLSPRNICIIWMGRGGKKVFAKNREREKTEMRLGPLRVQKVNLPNQLTNAVGSGTKKALWPTRSGFIILASCARKM